MASDLSSCCTEVIEIFDEKEEGEISLEDVSSSEEGHVNDPFHLRSRAGGLCPRCFSTTRCATWCNLSNKGTQSKNIGKKDAVQEKENCHNAKDSGYSGSKHSASTLHEKNNDLIPISSDSDMEIIGMAENKKQSLAHSRTTDKNVRKRRRKKRSQNTTASAENSQASVAPDDQLAEKSSVKKHNFQHMKIEHFLRSRHKESSSSYKRPKTTSLLRSKLLKSPMKRRGSPNVRSESPYVGWKSPSHRSRSPDSWISPLDHIRSPVTRRTPPTRIRSPVRRSPVRSPTRSHTKRSSNESESPNNTYIDMYGNVNKLLKKVRQSTNRDLLKQNSQGSSLKEKINNMMKCTDGNDACNETLVGSSNSTQANKRSDDVDEDDDLMLLRKMALETKSKKRKKQQPVQSQAKDEEVPFGSEPGSMSNDDIEDLELRMIALRSAMLKKHQDRMQRGLMIGKPKKPAESTRTNAESPFSESFLDGISAPAAGQSNLKTPPLTPTEILNENKNAEDMELDSEVEMEKEKEAEPYSPTDEISHEINVETELLGIQSSDVSFITPNNRLITLPNSSNPQIPCTSESFPISTQSSPTPSIPILPNNFITVEHPYYDTNRPPTQQCTTSNSYIPPDSLVATKTVDEISSSQMDDHLHSMPYSPSQPVDINDMFPLQQEAYDDQNVVEISDTPYSPTDTPIYDPELTSASSMLDLPSLQEYGLTNSPNDRLTNKYKKTRSMPKHNNLISIELDCSTGFTKPGKNRNAESTTKLTKSLYPKKTIVGQNTETETWSTGANVGSACDSSDDSINSLMITVDELPETDLDGSPLIPVPNPICDIQIHVPASLSDEPVNTYPEPLYLQGVPDVTKDVNKIPTLLNRSLVPAPILKTNKNLQQPLPPKKLETHLEPAFKSAEMQPVQITTESVKANSSFKPIKLAVAVKKPKLNIIKPDVFNNSSNNNSLLGDEDNDEILVAKNTCTAKVSSNEPSDSPKTLAAISKTVNTKPSQAMHDGRTSTGRKMSVAKRQEPIAKDSKKTDSDSMTRLRNRRRRRKSEKKSKQVSKEDRDSTNCVAAKSEKDDCPDTRLTIEKTKSRKKSSGTRESSTAVEPAEETMALKSNSEIKEGKIKRRSTSDKHKVNANSVENIKDRNENEIDETRTSKQMETLTELVPLSTKPDYEQSSRLAGTDDASEIKSNDKLVEKERRSVGRKCVTSDSSVVEQSSMSFRSDNTSVDTCNPTESTCSSENTKSQRMVIDADVESKDSESLACKKVNNNKRRRSSLDEDEEALRAVLLASLAKRSKPSSSVSSSQKTDTDTVNDESAKALLRSRDDNTPILSNQTHSMTNNSSNVMLKAAVTPTAQNTVTDSVNSKNMTATGNNVVPPIISSRKKLATTNIKASQKPVIKKIPIPASTKVVNNAKKYQNTLVQKKLNSQKATFVSNTQASVCQKNVAANKATKEKPSRTTITPPLSDIKRFVINLASDSESEIDTESPDNNITKPKNSQNQQQKPLAIPMSDFEKSVDMFLKDVRKKQETAAAVKPTPKVAVTQIVKPPKDTTSQKSSDVSVTPLAVRHLPASRQEEYRRLKQQILERERLKLQRTLLNNNSPVSPGSKSSNTPPGPLSPASPVTSPVVSKRPIDTRTNLTNSTPRPATETGLRNVNLTSSPKNTTSSGIPESASVGKNTTVKPISGLTIEIPNKQMHVDIACNKSNSSDTSDAVRRNVSIAPVKVAVVPIKNNNAQNTLFRKGDPSNFTRVQIQLRQGMKGRTVSLGDEPGVTKRTIVLENKENKTDLNTDIDTVKVDANCPSESINSNDTMNLYNVSGNSDASTVILPRREGCDENSTLIDSQASTTILPKDESNNTRDSLIDNDAKNHDNTTHGIIEEKKQKDSADTWKKIKDDVKNEVDRIAALPVDKQKSHLLTIEQDLVTKRYAVLDDLTKISGSLQQLELEREVQANMSAEVKKLQEQLKLAEERLHSQRNRVNSLVPQVTAAYEKFNNVRRECVKLTRICLGLGSLVIGANYKIPAAGARLLNNRLKQVAGCTRQLGKRKTLLENHATEDSDTTDLSNQDSHASEISLRCPSFDITPTNECANEVITLKDSESNETVTVIRAQNDNHIGTTIVNDAEMKSTDILQQRQTKLPDRLPATNDEVVSINLLGGTSTPNSTETCDISTYVKQSENNPMQLLSDTLNAGPSRRKNPVEPARFLQPYKSVLSHLAVSRTKDPDGILCPYELMGTCRDEDCQFVHQSPRSSS